MLHRFGGPIFRQRTGQGQVGETQTGTFVFFLLQALSRHPGAIKGEAQLVSCAECEFHGEAIGSGRHGDPSYRLEAGGMTPVAKIDSDNFAFVGFLSAGFHLESVDAKFGNGELIVGFRIDGKMQIAAVGAKTGEDIFVSVAVISTSARRKVLAAVKMPHIKFPRSRFGFRIRQYPLGNEACRLEVGHHLMR